MGLAAVFLATKGIPIFSATSWICAKTGVARSRGNAELESFTLGRRRAFVGGRYRKVLPHPRVRSSRSARLWACLRSER